MRHQTFIHFCLLYPDKEFFGVNKQELSKIGIFSIEKADNHLRLLVAIGLKKVNMANNKTDSFPVIFLCPFFSLESFAN